MIGIDEVGRGAWAGPLLVVAARLKPHMDFPDGLTDSKLLSAIQKQRYYEQLLIACEHGEGWVSVEELDSIGLSAALTLGATRAIAVLGNIENEEIIIDGAVDFLKDLDAQSRAVVKADITIPVVSAASVIAKVLRDSYMRKLHYESPQYGYDSHVGYGTAAHIVALKKHGVSPHHRKSFKPIMELL